MAENRVTVRARVIGKNVREGTAFAELHVKRTEIPLCEGVIPMSRDEAEQYRLWSFVTITVEAAEPLASGN
jgi:hypothetical protein